MWKTYKLVFSEVQFIFICACLTKVNISFSVKGVKVDFCLTFLGTIWVIYPSWKWNIYSMYYKPDRTLLWEVN